MREKKHKRLLRCAAMVLTALFFMGISPLPAKAEVKISHTSVILKKGESKKIKIKGSSSKVKWSSGNSKIASVSSQGIITALKAGTTTVKATVKTKVYKCQVKVIGLNSTQKTLSKGQSYQLKVTNGKNSKWSSSNPSVVKVSSKGLIKAQKNGTAVITCKSNGKKLTCKVYVPRLSTQSVELYGYDDIYDIDLVYYYGSRDWRSSNPSVVTVTDHGVVSAKKAGSATITCKNNGKTLSCKVRVYTLNEKEATLKHMGDEVKLSISSNYKGNVLWSSSDPAVATVDSQGKVTANSTGSSVICCRLGSRELQCYVYTGYPIYTSRDRLPLSSAGNRITANIACVKETEEGFQEEERSYSIYKQATNKLTTPQLVDTVEDRDMSSYMPSHGCAACSLATILNVTPQEVIMRDGVEFQAFGEEKWTANYKKADAKQMPVSLLGIQTALTYYGVKSEYVQSFKDAQAVSQIREHLLKGNPVIFEVCDRQRNFGASGSVESTKWTTGRHTMIMLGLTMIDGEEYAIIADSADRDSSVHGTGNKRIKYASIREMVTYMFSNTQKADGYYYQSKSKSGGYILVEP